MQVTMPKEDPKAEANIAFIRCACFYSICKDKLEATLYLNTNIKLIMCLTNRQTFVRMQAKTR